MAREIFRQQAMAIGRLFTVAANFTDPDIYFLGGGVVEAAAEFRDWFLATVREHTDLREEQAASRPSRSCPTWTWPERAARPSPPTTHCAAAASTWLDNQRRPHWGLHDQASSGLLAVISQARASCCYQAVLWLSLQARSSAAANASAGWAPETAYRSSRTVNGTPLMPSALALASSARTASA